MGWNQLLSAPTQLDQFRTTIFKSPRQEQVQTDNATGGLLDGRGCGMLRSQMHANIRMDCVCGHECHANSKTAVGETINIRRRRTEDVVPVVSQTNYACHKKKCGTRTDKGLIRAY